MIIELPGRTLIGLNKLSKKLDISRDAMIRKFLTELIDYAVREGELKEGELDVKR